MCPTNNQARAEPTMTIAVDAPIHNHTDHGYEQRAAVMVELYLLCIIFEGVSVGSMRFLRRSYKCRVERVVLKRGCAEPFTFSSVNTWIHNE